MNKALPLLDEYGYPLRPNSQRTLRNVAVRMSKHLLRLAIYGIMSMLGAIIQLSSRGEKRHPLTPATFVPHRILIIRVDLIGDLVMSLTALRVLKRTYPEAEIDVLAVPTSAKVVASDPDIAQVIVYDPNIWRRPRALMQWYNWRKLFALRRELHARHYDLTINLFGEWASALTLLSGAPRRLGFSHENYPGILTDSVTGRHWDSNDHKHEVDYCLDLAQAAGATVSSKDRIPHLTVDSKAVPQVEQLLQQEGIQTDRPLVACHVSSNNGYAKRWPIPYWATLLDQLIREDRMQVVLTGGPDDVPLIMEVVRRMHEQPINLAGKTSLTHLAALYQRTNVVVTGDSGPMHIAAAVGTPLIAIHGPTDPALSGPVSSAATILRSTIWCSPCYNAKGPADCRFHTTQCMKDITPDQVYEVVREKMGRTNLPRPFPSPTKIS